MSVNDRDGILSQTKNVPQNEQESNEPVLVPQEETDIDTAAEQHLQPMPSPLRTVQDVLDFDERGRARMESEGITEVEHIHDLEDMLRDGKVTGLTSVEKVTFSISVVEKQFSRENKG
jgi:hypothetical protein